MKKTNIEIVPTDYIVKEGTGSFFFEMADYFEDYKEEIDGDITLNVKDENSKLQKTEDIIYIIWNLPCYITCPYATEACKLACYAELPERDYRKDSVLPSRYRNLAACTGDNAETFVRNMIATIKKQLNKPSYKKAKEIRVRIHESGDFFSEEYAMQWIAIAKFFKYDKRVVFEAYTKSVIFFDGVKLPTNFVLRASVWQDTSIENLEIIKRNGWPLYMAIPETMINDMPKKWIECTCENCSTCKKHCFSRRYKNIFVLLHGREAKKLKKDEARLKEIIDYLSGKTDSMAA